MSLLITLQSLVLSHVITFTSTNLLKDNSKIIIQELKLKGNAPEVLCHVSKSLLENGFIVEDQLVEYLLIAAQNTTKFQLKTPSRLISWVNAQGDSISTFLEPNGTYSTAVLKPFALPPLGLQFFRDHNNKIIKTLSVPAIDLRTNPSWNAAVDAKELIWTDVFLSSPNKNLTTSAVTPVFTKTGQLYGVFTVNISMEGTSAFLKTLKIGKEGVPFLINGQDELIAFPGMNKEMHQELGRDSLNTLQKINKPWVAVALTEYKKHKKTSFTFTYNHKRYVANFVKVPEEILKVAAYNWKVGVVVPEEDFTGDIQRKSDLMKILGIIIVICGILIASIFSKLVTNRINMLVDETNKIKNFQFDGEKVDSVISEVYLLANAIYSMKMNLRSFKKYLPANLVQQLIQSGQDIHLGGDIRTLSILFSDIRNFTQLSEVMSPDQLMKDLSEYLENISGIISTQLGTIDKFIGDSIMAFWNAPLEDINHCEHACRTAILCRNKVNQLNEQWTQQGKTPFITRYGIHTGDVIVGNVGSIERMNYTAMGDNINVTSRLEGLNKVYGTSIIASDQVVKLVGSLFVFRKIDITAIKGKSGGYLIYELMAENPSELSFDFTAYQPLFEEGFAAYQKQNWEVAIDTFLQALQVYPGDCLAPIFIKRCEQFQKNQLPSDWDGVWRGY